MGGAAAAAEELIPEISGAKKERKKGGKEEGFPVFVHLLLLRPFPSGEGRCRTIAEEIGRGPTFR